MFSVADPMARLQTTAYASRITEPPPKGASGLLEDVHPTGSGRLGAPGVPGIHYYLMQTAAHVKRVIEPALKSA